MTDSVAALSCESLAVAYGENAVGVEDVSFSLPEASIVALVGPNGAGKSTTLRGISGFLRSEAGKVAGGRVIAFGQDITGLQPHEVARHGISLVPEDQKVFRRLTVEENLQVSPEWGQSRSDAVDFALRLFPALSEKWKAQAGLLSGGQRQMLAISIALVNAPRILLADELSHGIAPVLVSEIMQAVARIRAELGTSVVLVEQNVRSALQIADYVYVIERGRIAWSGSPSEAASDRGFARVYLGLGTRGS